LAEFDLYAEKLTKYRNDNPRDGIQVLGFAYIGQIMSWASVWGVDFWDPNTRTVLVDTPRMVEFLEWLKTNVDKYGYRSQRGFLSSLGNTVSPNNPFLTGQLTMIVVGEWYKKIIEMYAPPGFEWGYFAFPAPPGGRANATILNASMFTIPTASRHKQEAWDFIAWITAPAQTIRFRVGPLPGDMAAASAVQSDPGYDTPYWRFVKDLVNSPNARGIKLPLFNKFMYLMNQVEERVLSGEATPQQALTHMRTTFQSSVAEVFRDPPPTTTTSGSQGVTP
jgi:ABC-type glycerol-3-phosphate transport system substrate-binding protein